MGLSTRVLRPIAVFSVLILGGALAGCGGADTSNSTAKGSSSTSSAASASASPSKPAAIPLPTTLKTKFCAGLDAKAAAVVIGAKVQQRTTGRSDAKFHECILSRKVGDKYSGVTIAFSETRQKALPDLRTSLATQGPCTDHDLPGISPNDGFALSCRGHDKHLSFGPRDEEVIVRIGQGQFYCQVYTDPSLKLAVDTSGAQKYCLDQLAAIS